MSTVYLVVSSAYSDYTVHAVCRSEKHAKRCVDEYNRRYQKQYGSGCRYGYRVDSHDVGEYISDEHAIRLVLERRQAELAKRAGVL